MNQQLDWRKIGLLFVAVVGSGYAVTSKLNFTLPEMPTPSAVPIPTPSANYKSAVQPLVTAKATNLRAAAVVGDFLASYAFILENSEVHDSYNSSALTHNIEDGLESMFVLQKEVGDVDIGDALNQSLQTIWGDQTRQLTKEEASKGIYACAWALR